MATLELGDGLEFDQGFVFDRLRLIFVVEDSFQLILAAEEAAHGLSVVECEATFLDS